MTLFEIADMLWQRGENEAYSALIESIMEQAPWIDDEAELQLDDDRWAEARMRACERNSPNSPGFLAIIRGIYEQLCEEGWRAA